ncbi:hypothetical protein [Desulfonema magnum]|uniref:Uncharacterized protein n=1 Tax=Desulfonema magnum TaxID=45655 RepID=A0A975GR96_9BACT|nr:hypothetical protein [Desulfonema magnum]QTA90806.1 Uncharacterized protein dnm_068670 [Desulfonema magnum]
MKMKAGNRIINNQLSITIVLLTLITLNTALAWSESEWGGHVRARGAVSWPDDESVFQLADTGPYYDSSGEFRLKTKAFFADWGFFETHYEAILSGGDTWQSKKFLERLSPDFFKNNLGGNPNDDLRLMDLTKTIDEDDDYIFYHRLDRLSLTLQPKWGTVCIGRQALTWGNGMLFNPMDLFNPFSPTDIERDYKIGDDMLTGQLSIKETGEFQFLYVPRRDMLSHDVEWDSSSLAGKLHFAAGTTEFDVMVARHYKDYIGGIGSTGYMGNAAWRMDATWTFLNAESGTDSFISLVANMDYSWVWWEKNFYGLIEFYYNGLGQDEYAEAMTDLDILPRLARGEMFTLGKTYLAGEIHLELHPLFNTYLTLLTNLSDPSGVLQPRAVWDITQDIQGILGANVYYGGKDTEFGGFRMPYTDFLEKPPNSVFLWLTWFF